jgi:hypothetical protein
MTQHRTSNRLWLGVSLLTALASITAWGCASDSHSEQVSAQEERTRQEVAALRAELATMQRDFQARLADLERQTRRVQEETTIERQRTPNPRKMQAETEELRRQIDQYADKTKHMLGALIQAFVDVANEIQADSPSKESSEPALPEERLPEPPPQERLPQSRR